MIGAILKLVSNHSIKNSRVPKKRCYSSALPSYVLQVSLYLGHNHAGKSVLWTGSNELKKNFTTGAREEHYSCISVVFLVAQLHRRIWRVLYHTTMLKEDRHVGSYVVMSCLPILTTMHHWAFYFKCIFFPKQLKDSHILHWNLLWYSLALVLRKNNYH